MRLITPLSSSQFYPESLYSPEMSRNHDALFWVNLISDGATPPTIPLYLCSTLCTLSKVVEAFSSLLAQWRLRSELNVRLTGDKADRAWKLRGGNFKWLAAGFDASLRNVNI